MTRLDFADKCNIASLVISALAILIAVLAMAGAAMGQALFITPPSEAMQCPPERPIKKTVDTGFATCTLLACIGKLVCPPDVLPGTAECFRMPASDCNTCTRSVSEICLSQEELEQAR